jgi:hypothetical protein
MGFPKEKRIVDETILDWARNRPCDVCRTSPPSDPAHIQTRKSSGPDIKENLWSLCRLHHVEQGAIGIKSFAEKYGLPLKWIGSYPRRDDL